MAKTKISEYDVNAANNTDVDGVNLAEGCPPSGINNAIREIMAHLKDWQSGVSGDGLTTSGAITSSGTLTQSGTLAVTGNLTLDGASGTSGQYLASAGSGATPTWTTLPLFVTGMIIMWSGTVATIPSGWALCDGTSGTPDLRDKFVIGARADDGGAAKTNVTGSYTQTGGSKDAIVVSHTHIVTDPGHTHTYNKINATSGSNVGWDTFNNPVNYNDTGTTNSATTGISIASAGSSGTNANLPPYYALAFIMKT